MVITVRQSDAVITNRINADPDRAGHEGRGHVALVGEGAHATGVAEQVHRAREEPEASAFAVVKNQLQEKEDRKVG